MSLLLTSPMAPDTAATSEFQGREIMASVDGDCLIIADLGREDAWIEIPLADAASLGDRR